MNSHHSRTEYYICGWMVVEFTDFIEQHTGRSIKVLYRAPLIIRNQWLNKICRLNRLLSEGHRMRGDVLAV